MHQSIKILGPLSSLTGKLDFWDHHAHWLNVRVNVMLLADAPKEDFEIISVGNDNTVD